MSRRYGRNQKRRARQEIEGLRLQLGQKSALSTALTRQIADAERKASALQAVIDGVRVALGEKAFALEPGMHMAMDYYTPRVVVDARHSAEIPLDPWSAAPLEFIRTETASVLTACVEPDHIARRVHFYIEFEDRKEVGYAIDAHVLHEWRGHDFDDLIRRRIVDALARGFIAKLRGVL